MRKPTTRESVYLVILGAVLIGFLLMRGGDGLIGGGSGDDASALEPGEAPVVQLARLSQAPDEYDRSGRNLFQYGQPPRVNRPPPPVQRPVVVPQPQVRKPPPKRDPPKPRPPTVAKRQPPRPDFDYLGYLGPKGNRIAVFEEEDMILARMGDIVRENFLVVEFKYETVVLGYTDKEFEGQTTELQIKKK